MQPGMNYRNIADRLTRMNARITDSERIAGIAWYHRANDVVHGLSADYDIPADYVAAVIAALSPNVRWSTNVNAARTMLAAWYHGGDEPIVPGYTANRTKAWDILRTGNPDILSGPKVEAFAANLRGDLEYVTLDMWAMRAVGGGDTPKNKTERANVERGYRLAASRAGMSAAEFQAVIWVHVRGGAE